jgi:4-amino-4-deoxy-L-arabinose transferase-like glycosyltransferase
VFITRLPRWSDTLEFLRFHESHPPLFYAILRGWISAFGAADTTMIVVPVVFGALQIPAAYLAGRLFFSERVGLIAALLISISPALVEFSGLLRPYSFLPLCVLLGAICLILAIEKGRWEFWLGFALTLVAISLTHNWALLTAVGYLVAVFVSIPLFPRGRKQTLIEAGVSFGIFGIVYLPWLPTALYQSGNAGYPPLELDGLSGIVRVAGMTLFMILRSTFIGIPNEMGLRIFLVNVIPAAVLSTWGLVAASRRSRPRHVARQRAPEIGRGEKMALMVLLVTPVVTMAAALALSARSNLLLQRCVVMLTPLILVAFAFWIVRKWERVRGAPGGLQLACAIGLVLVGNNLGGLASILSQPRSNARELANGVGHLTRADDFVIVAPVWIASSFNYYYRQPLHQYDFPDGGRREAVDFMNVWQRMADEKALMDLQHYIRRAGAESRRIWLVTDVESIRALSASDVADARMKGHFPALGALRVGEIRAFLLEQYGPPRDSLGIPANAARYERLVAFLYTPRKR